MRVVGNVTPAFVQVGRVFRHSGVPVGTVTRPDTVYEMRPGKLGALRGPGRIFSYSPRGAFAPRGVLVLHLGATQHPRPMRRSPAIAAVQREAVALAEVIVATAVTAMSGAALLTAIASSLSVSEWTLRREIAVGLGQQMIAELHSAPFPEPPTTGGYGGYGGYGGGYGNYGCGTTSFGRDHFCNLDAYANWSAQPPVDRCGIAIGTGGISDCQVRNYATTARDAAGFANVRLLQRFRRSVQIERLESSGGVWTVTTDNTRYRRATVRVEYVDSSNVAHELFAASEVIADASP